VGLDEVDRHGEGVVQVRERRAWVCGASGDDPVRGVRHSRLLSIVEAGPREVVVGDLGTDAEVGLQPAGHGGVPGSEHTGLITIAVIGL